MDKNIDYTKLSPELREKLQAIEDNSPAQKQLKALEKLAGVLTLLLDGINQLNQQDLDGNSQTQEILSDIRNAMEVINGREEPETPDFATPVVERLAALEKTLTKSLKDIDVKPEVNVAAPQVDVQAPKVDLKGIETALKQELPKAFGEAIARIPQTETDLSPLEDRLDRAIEWLENIDAASRMKPQFPSTLKVTNPDGSTISSSGGATAYATRLDDYSTANISYIGKAVPGTATSAAAWQISRMDETTGTVITFADGNASFDNIWDNRTGLTYA